MKITSKQRKLAQAYLENAGSSRAIDRKELMLKVGYSRSTAEKKTAEVFKSPGFIAALEEMGATETNIMSVISNALEANLCCNYRGEIFQTDLPDHKVRLLAVKNLADIIGWKHKKTVQLERTGIDSEEIMKLLDLG